MADFLWLYLVHQYFKALTHLGDRNGIHYVESFRVLRPRETTDKKACWTKNACLCVKLVCRVGQCSWIWYELYSQSCHLWATCRCCGSKAGCN